MVEETAKLWLMLLLYKNNNSCIENNIGDILYTVIIARRPGELSAKKAKYKKQWDYDNPVFCMQRTKFVFTKQRNLTNLKSESVAFIPY